MPLLAIVYFSISGTTEKLAHAVARKCGLPVSLVSGSGGQLSEALVRNEFVDCLSFVGGKTNGGVIASTLYDEAEYLRDYEVFKREVGAHR